jgi:hypothetical protein
MLSTTFSTIVSNATAEIQFRRAVLTLEGVKSDAIFAYQPPLNIFAILILLPLKQVVTPRWFHKINVTAVRTLNAPLLLIIGFVERRTLWSGIRRQKDVEQLPKTPHSRLGLWDFSRGFSVHGDIQAVFDAEPPQEIEEEIDAEDDLNTHTLEQAFAREFGGPSKGTENKNSDGASDMPRPGLKRTQKSKSFKSRRDSVMPFVGMSQRMKDFLNEGSEDEDEDGWKSRLEKLEKSTGRIEEMLGRLCEELDEGPTHRKRGESENVGGETSTLHDLDRSGTADIQE